MIMKENILEVTKMEKQILESLAQGMYAELGYSDMGIDDIAKDTGLDRKVIRGVAGSLIKKDLISIDDREGEGYKNQMDMHIWYLTYQTQGLVEHWVGEERFWDNLKVQPVTLVEKN